MLCKIKLNREHLTLMLENALTLPRHSQRNSTLADSIGQYIMRKFGKIGLLTGTQVFFPTQFHSMVRMYKALDITDSNIDMIISFGMMARTYQRGATSLVSILVTCLVPTRTR